MRIPNDRDMMHSYGMLFKMVIDKMEQYEKKTLEYFLKRFFCRQIQ